MHAVVCVVLMCMRMWVRGGGEGGGGKRQAQQHDSKQMSGSRVSAVYGAWSVVNRHPWPQRGNRSATQTQPTEATVHAYAAYDADMVIKVTSGLRASPECDGSDAVSKTGLFDTLTKRPIFGQIRMCSTEPTTFLPITLQVVLHEIFHMLVRSPLPRCWPAHDHDSAMHMLHP